MSIESERNLDDDPASDDRAGDAVPGASPLRGSPDVRASPDAASLNTASPDAAPEAGDSPDLRDAARPGAGEVTARIIVRAPAEKVFQALIAWERQGEWIPFTRVQLVDGDGGEGSTLLAVTQVGPAVLRDEMRVVKVDPPYEIRVVHYGRVLRGPGVMRCTPMAGGRTQVVWHEWLHLPGGASGRVAWPVMWPGSKVSLTAALRRFARLVEAGDLP